MEGKYLGLLSFPVHSYLLGSCQDANAGSVDLGRDLGFGTPNKHGGDVFVPESTDHTLNPREIIDVAYLPAS